MTTFTADLWRIDLADGWLTEPSGAGVTIFHPAGVGTLKVGASRKDADLSRDDLLAATGLDAEWRRYLGERKWGEFDGFQMVGADGDAFWRKWWLAAGNVLLVVAYNCPNDVKETERLAVNQMMDSLRLRRP